MFVFVNQKAISTGVVRLCLNIAILVCLITNSIALEDASVKKVGSVPITVIDLTNGNSNAKPATVANQVADPRPPQEIKTVATNTTTSTGTLASVTKGPILAVQTSSPVSASATTKPIAIVAPPITNAPIPLMDFAPCDEEIDCEFAKANAAIAAALPNSSGPAQIATVMHSNSSSSHLPTTEHAATPGAHLTVAAVPHPTAQPVVHTNTPVQHVAVAQQH